MLSISGRSFSAASAPVAPTLRHRPRLQQQPCHSRRAGRPVSMCPPNANADVSRRGRLVACGVGKDAMEGWLDITKLVSGGAAAAKTPYDDLASSIGKDVYVDVAGWHLYMRDMNAVPGLKMSQLLAQQLGPQVQGGRGAVRESDVVSLLKKVPVKLGSGKLQVSLFEVMPSMCVGDLVRLLEDYARK